MSYRRIALPLARPAIAAVSIFTFVWTWNNFLWPFLAATSQTMMTIPAGPGTVVDGVGIINALQMASAVLARRRWSSCSCWPSGGLWRVSPAPASSSRYQLGADARSSSSSRLLLALSADSTSRRLDRPSTSVARALRDTSLAADISQSHCPASHQSMTR